MEGLANLLVPLSCNFLLQTSFLPPVSYSYLHTRLSPLSTTGMTFRHSFVIVTLVSAAVAFGLGTLFRLKRSQRSFAMCASMFQNSNSLPIALIQVRSSGQNGWGVGVKADL